MPIRTKKAATPPSPLPRVGRAMLLITKEELRNQTRYPTMSMILRGLFTTVILALYCFQQDGLLKSTEIASSNPRSHDVVHHKRVRQEARKSGLLFSIGYPGENAGNSGAFNLEPTISLRGNGLEARRHFSATSYLIENRPRSSLALKNEAFKPTMCMKQKGYLQTVPFRFVLGSVNF
jgi:hypothetical protein